MRNRLRQIRELSREEVHEIDFDSDSARLVIGDEVGFASWDELVRAVTEPADQRYPLLFQYTIAAMVRGDFSALESMVGGPENFHDQIVEWYEKGLFRDE